MKKLIAKFCVILFTPLVFLGSAFAAPYTTYWFDPTGAGNFATAIKVNEFLDYTGAVYSQNNYTTANEFDANQYGYARIKGADSIDIDALYNSQLFASYSGGGHGDLSSGRVFFDDGTINLFVPGFSGTTIATFDITGGEAQIDNFGAPLLNGHTTLIGNATFVAAGYFFVDNGGSLGEDLSNILNNGGEFITGIATGNLSLTTNADTLASQQGVLGNAFPGTTFQANTQDDLGRYTHLTSGSNGQWRMTIGEIPEPGVLSLVGLAFLLMGLVTRRQVN